MADENSSEEPKKSKKKMLMIVGGVLLAGGVASQTVLKSPPPEPVDETAEVEIEEGDILPMPEMVLNLADNELHYARVGVALVLEKGTSADAFEPETPIAMDVIVEVLSGKTFEELRTPGSQAAVKAELSEKVRAAYDDEKVARVLFTTFVMQ